MATNVGACDGRGGKEPRPVPDENVNVKPEKNEDKNAPPGTSTLLCEGRATQDLINRFKEVGFCVSDGVTDFVPESDRMISLFFKVGNGDKDVYCVTLDASSLYDLLKNEYKGFADRPGSISVPIQK
jgi:hypothetical protein